MFEKLFQSWDLSGNRMKERIMGRTILSVPQKVFDYNIIPLTPDTTNSSMTRCDFERKGNAFQDDKYFDDCSNAPTDDFRKGNLLGDAAGVNATV